MQCQSAVMAGAEAEQELVSKLKKDVNLINAKVDGNIVNSNGIANRYLLSIFSHAMCIAIICISIAIIPKESSSKLEKYLCKTVNDGIKGHNHEV